MLTAKMKKVNGKLVFANDTDKIKFEKFKKSVDENDIVRVYMESSKGNGTLDQLAKVHKLIRIIAIETGNKFEDIKLLIKYRSGLAIKHKVFDNEMINVLSFADASKEELSKAIEECIILGEELGIILS